MIPVIIAFPVLVLWALRDRWARRALLIYFVLVLGLLTETFKLLHYVAPIIGLNYYFVLNALRLAQWRNRKIGRTHAMADSAPGYRRAGGIFIWNYQEG